jgi:hypothetical protein
MRSVSANLSRSDHVIQFNWGSVTELHGFLNRMLCAKGETAWLRSIQSNFGRKLCGWKKIGGGDVTQLWNVVDI